MGRHGRSPRIRADTGLDDLIFVTGVLGLDPSPDEDEDHIMAEGVLMIRRTTGREGAPQDGPVEKIQEQGTEE